VLQHKLAQGSKIDRQFRLSDTVVQHMHPAQPAAPAMCHAHSGKAQTEAGHRGR